MNLFRQVTGTRPLAIRSTVVAVAVALLVAALGSTLFTVALHDTLVSGLQTFAMFGTLAAAVAGFLAWEITTGRSCPHCGGENQPGATACDGCGYDLRARPRYACTEGHAVVYEPGLCDCGRRLLALQPPPLPRQVLRIIWVALAFFVLFIVINILLTMFSE